MLMEGVSVRDLWIALDPYMQKSAWPGLDDPKIVKKAKAYAKRSGLWDRIAKEMHAYTNGSLGDLPGIPFSVDHGSQLSGRRTGYRAYIDERERRLKIGTLALWLQHPDAQPDYLHDVIWSYCDMVSWCAPAHRPPDVIDLHASHIAKALSEILFVLGDQLHPKVVTRLSNEIERRVYTVLNNKDQPSWWMTVRMNWSHVCLSNIITTAMYTIKDAEALATYIHPLCLSLDYGIQGFADDGGCLEGPSYWNYGFGHFLNAAVVLHNKTGGRIDLAQMNAEKIENICRSPLASHVKGPLYANYSDGNHGYLDPETALKANRFFKIPELYNLVNPKPKAHFELDNWRSIALYEGQTVQTSHDHQDYLLPDTGFAKFRASKKPATVLMALAGANWWPHSHNDMGSFIYYTKGFMPFVDPGATPYTKETFGPDRYHGLCIGSQGHSVPVVNGNYQIGVENGDYNGGVKPGIKQRKPEQPIDGMNSGIPGGFFPKASLSVEGLNESGSKTACMEIKEAYPDETLTSLCRHVTLNPDGSLHIEDHFTFTRKPRSIKEVFITFSKASLINGGKKVKIASGSKSVIMDAAKTPGSFKLEVLKEESEAVGAKGLLTRVCFVPSTLSKDMVLRFLVV